MKEPARNKKQNDDSLKPATKQNHLAQILARRKRDINTVPINETVSQITFPPQFAPMERTFVSRKNRHADAFAQIFELYENADGMAMARKVSTDVVAAALCEYIDQHLHIAQCRPYASTFTEAEKTVIRFVHQTAEVTDKDFTKVGFKTSPAEPCMFRLPFDPEEVDPNDSLKNAPFWASVLARTSNADALCHKIYSLFDDRSNRKQSVYIYGGGDTGKSCISAALAELLNARSPDGAAMIHNPPSGGKVDASWASSLEGKKLLVYNEAPHRFMETAEFKAITGEAMGSVRFMYEGWRVIDLNMQIFFVSNEDPEVSSRPEILRRIIACRVGAITDGKTMSSDEVLGEMLREMPWFLGHCKMVYGRTRTGMPVASDTTELMEHVADGMADDLALFHDLFEITGKESDTLSRAVVRDIARGAGVRNDAQFKILRALWQREGLLMLSEKSIGKGDERKTVRYYVGVTLKRTIDNPFTRGAIVDI